MQTYAKRPRSAKHPVDAGPKSSGPDRVGSQSLQALLTGTETPAKAAMGRKVSLPDAIRSRMETSFGADFSHVEVYESPAVAEAGAQAITTGRKIGFAPGELNFASTSGQALLGHELSHVVSQSRGEVTGTGFLQDSALETRADLEGAKAAAGEQVYSGPVTPLSTSSAAAAAGPMQAKKPKDKQPKNVEMETVPETAAAPAAPAAALTPEENEERIINSEAGPKTARALETQNMARKKQREIDRARKGHGNSRNQLLRNTKFGKWATKAKDSVVDSVVDKAQSIRRKHWRAVDDFNNNEEDYRAMSAWERFKWTAANPAARMSASFKKKDTEARNQELMREDILAARWAEKNSDAVQQSDASKVDGSAAPEEELSGTAAFVKNTVLDGVGQTGVGFAAKAAGSAAPSLTDVSKAAQGVSAPLSSGQLGLGAVSGGLQTLGSAMGMAANLDSAISQGQKGDRAGAAVKGLDTIGSAAEVGSGLAQTGAYLANTAGAASTVSDKVIPGLGIVTGGMKMLSGATKLGTATRARLNIGSIMDRFKAKKETGSLSEEDSKISKMADQAFANSKIRQTEGAFDSVSGGLSVAASGLTLGGVTALAGTAVSGASTAVDLVKGMVTGGMKKNMRSDVLNSELGLQEKIQALVDQGEDPRTAKHIVLKGMGHSTGKRSQAFQHVTMRRSKDLVDMAGDGDHTSHGGESARSLIEAMGISKTGSGYSLQGVSEMMGMDSGTSWQSQMEETEASRAANPFAKKAAEARKKREEREKAPRRYGNTRNALLKRVFKRS